MANRVSNPLPGVEWAERAYQSAAYMSISNGNELDETTGQFTTLPRFTADAKPITGSPGEVFTQLDFKVELGVDNDVDKLNMIFLMGYMYGQLAEIERPTFPGAKNG